VSLMHASCSRGYRRVNPTGSRPPTDTAPASCTFSVPTPLRGGWWYRRPAPVRAAGCGRLTAAGAARRGHLCRALHRVALCGGCPSPVTRRPSGPSGRPAAAAGWLPAGCTASRLAAGALARRGWLPVVYAAQGVHSRRLNFLYVSGQCWKDPVDAEKLIKNICESRLISTRPVSTLDPSDAEGPPALQVL
jgi:hypothetical protein